MNDTLIKVTETINSLEETKLIISIYLLVAMIHFWNITIDNNQKKAAWLKLVEFLDNLEELDDTNLFIKGMNSIYINKINCNSEKTKNNVINLLSGDIKKAP